MKIFFENNKTPYKIINFYCHEKETVPLPHWQHQLEFIYVRKGEMAAFINGEKYNCKKGDLVCINVGEFHYTLKEKDAVTEIFILSTGVLNKFIKKYSLLCNYISSEQQKMFQVDKMFSDTFNNIIKCHNDNTAYDPQIIQSELIKVYLVCAKYFSANIGEIGLKGKLATIDMLKVYEYIENNYMDDIDLETISEITNYSKTYASKVFKEISGISFKKYLILTRIEKAAEMLINSNLSVEIISEKCGFKTQRAFYKQFVSVLGTSPTIYRNNVRKRC